MAIFSPRPAPRRRRRSTWQLEALEPRIVLDADNTVAGATPLGAAGTPISLYREITAYDIDFYRFTAEAGQEIVFDLDYRPGNLSAILRMWRLDATTNHLRLEGEHSFGPTPGETGNEPSIWRTLTQTGTYYVGVSSFLNNVYDPSTGLPALSDPRLDRLGPYTVTLSATGAADDRDDQIAEATMLGALDASRSTAGSIETDTDVDMFGFRVAAGQSIAFDIDLGSSNLVPYLRVFSASGTELGADVGSFAPGESPPPSRPAYCEYNFREAGTYYVAVSAYANTGYSPVTGRGDVASSQVGTYSLQLRTIDNLPDSNDQIAEALNLKAIRRTRTIRGTLDNSTDVDLYAFRAQAGQLLSFDTELAHEGRRLNTLLRLFNAKGAQLRSNDVGFGQGDRPQADYYESYLRLRFARAGTYTIAVSWNTNAAYDPIGGGDDDGNPFYTDNPLDKQYTLLIKPVGKGVGTKGVAAASADGHTTPTDAARASALAAADPPEGPAREVARLRRRRAARQGTTG